LETFFKDRDYFGVVRKEKTIEKERKN